MGAAEGKLAALGARLDLILPDEEADRGPSGDRYRLKARVFISGKDVMQFIQVFIDLTAVS